MVNAIVKQVPKYDFPDYLTRFKIYASICIFTYLFSLDFRHTLKLIFWSLALWLIACLFYVGFSIDSRLSGEGLNAVQIGKNAAMMGICGIYMCAYEKYKIKWVIIRVIYPLLFILLSQTRQAIAMVVIQAVGFYYSFIMNCKINMRSLVLVLFLSGAAIAGGTFVMESTNLGDRFQSDIDAVDHSRGREEYLTGTVFDYILGERIIYYAIGSEIFQENPLTGIGLTCYKSYTQGEFPMHVEWMVHLSEGGIIAFALYLIFLITIFLAIRNSGATLQEKMMRYSTLCVILFVNFFASSYAQEIPVIMYSLIISVNPYFGKLKDKKLVQISKVLKSYGKNV